MRGWLAQVQSDWHSKNPAWMDLSFWNSYSKLVDLGAKSEMPLAELSLRWLISQSFVDSVLVGFGNALEVEEDVAFVRRGALPPSILKEVDHLGIVHPLRYQGREYV